MIVEFVKDYYSEILSRRFEKGEIYPCACTTSAQFFISNGIAKEMSFEAFKTLKENGQLDRYRHKD